MDILALLMCVRRENVTYIFLLVHSESVFVFYEDKEIASHFDSNQIKLKPTLALGINS